MDICHEIEKAQEAVGVMAGKYAKDATFGNAKESDLETIYAINGMIQTLENNKPRTISVKRKVTEVALSSLRRRNNSLILDQSSLFECVDVEVSRCLSDEEICSLVEGLQILCNTTNC